MKRIILIGLSLILAMALVAAVGLAQGPGFGRGFGGGLPISNLTPEQSAKIQTLQQDHLKAISPLQQELLAKGTEMRSLSLNPNADPAVIGAKQKEIWEVRSKLQEMTNKFRLQIRGILTPEQQAQFDSLGPRRGMGPRMGRGLGPGLGSGSFGPGGGFGPGFGTPNQ